MNWSYLLILLLPLFQPPLVLANQLDKIEILEDTYAKEQVWYGRPYRSRNIYLGWDPYTKHGRTRPHIQFESFDIDNNRNEVFLNLYNWRPISSKPYNIKVYPIIDSWVPKLIEWGNQPMVGEPIQIGMVPRLPGWEKLQITEIFNRYPELTGLQIRMAEEYSVGAWFCSIDALNESDIDTCNYSTTPFISLETKLNSPTEIVFNWIADYLSIQWNSSCNECSFDVEYTLDSSFITSIKTTSENNKIDITELEPDKQYFFRFRTCDLEKCSAWSISQNFTIPKAQRATNNNSVGNDYINDETLNVLPDVKSAADNNYTNSIQKTASTETSDVVTDSSITQGAKPNTYNRDHKYICEFEYYQNSHKSKLLTCEIPSPTILNLKHQFISTNIYTLDISIQQNLSIDTFVHIYKCKTPSFWNPRTWFTCEKYKSNTISTTVTGHPIYIALLPNDRINIQQYNNTYKIYDDNNNQGEPLIIKSQIYISIKIDANEWLDYYGWSRNSNTLTVPQPSTQSLKSIYQLPINTPVGVTQWHGYTDYQSPHTGIDFGIKSEPVYAIADGIVEVAQWDKFMGECYSGGNILIIKHNNGRRSAYFHLTNYNTKDGQTLQKGDSINKGEQVGLTGNTGVWNCQKLGYHLHFEIRRTRSQSSHLDPVSIIKANWNNIPTLNASKYPGRLSGDNPHPGR